MSGERWTREQFLEHARSVDPDIDELLAMRNRDGSAYRTLVPCDCDYSGCHGWALVTRSMVHKP